MNKFFSFFCIFFIAVISGCNSAGNTSDDISKADAIYFGGDIITMEDDSAVYAEAVAVKEGKIILVGTKSEAELFKGDSTNMIDLDGKTLVPGFVDGHAHFHGFGAQAVGANLLASPDGIVNDMEGLISELKSGMQKMTPLNLPDGYSDWALMMQC
jgi:predicted amidohydrolase YtcJ